ncbi:hypothetical protein PanWU01x14_224580, partial [Parasponia andersonii]
MRTLETQLGQLANALTNQPQGALPSNIEVNLRNGGKEHYNAITLRSGKELVKNVEKPTSPSNPMLEEVLKKSMPRK